MPLWAVCFLLTLVFAAGAYGWVIEEEKRKVNK